MLEIESQEITIDYELRKKVENVCRFNNVVPTIINGSTKKIKMTNIVYIEPHKIIVKDILFLAFNNHEFIYLGNLENKLTFSEFDKLIKWFDKYILLPI